ncbi:MAG: ATP phosphoribosyltransferase regulatory subunit, partial [Rhodospirillales bacterium]
LATLARRILAALPGLPVTIDPVEYRGFEYQAGTAFTVFAAGVRGELGRGGRYVTPGGEPATGFTLFMDTIRRALPRPERRPRILLPVGTGFAQARNLRAAGWVTVESHEDGTDTAAEARRQGCGHVLTTEGPKAISKGE